MLQIPLGKLKMGPSAPQAGIAAPRLRRAQARAGATAQAQARPMKRRKQPKPPKPAAAKPRRSFAERFGRVDVPLITILMLLLAFGLVMLFSASYPTGHMRFGDSYAFIVPQLKYAGIGLIIMVGATFFDYHHLRKLAWPFMGITLVMLVVVLFMEEKNGAHRWIWLNSSHTQSIQPSELAKFGVIILFAAILAANQKYIKKFSHGFVPFMVILGIVSVLLLAEPHLSCTILVLGIGFIMMVAGGSPIRWLALTGIAAAVGLYLVLTYMPDTVPYVMERVGPWLDPTHSDSTQGHQITQSLIAVGSGGLFGNGLGNSVQKFLYLPEMYNDYIFAIVCEELGFVGAVGVVLLFLLLFLRGFLIALRAKDKFGSMLTVGIIVQIALQTFLHIAVNTNTIPCTGISLPFFSSGGSSLVMLLGEIGIVLSVSRQGAKTGLRAPEQPREGGDAALSPLPEPRGANSTDDADDGPYTAVMGG